MWSLARVFPGTRQPDAYGRASGESGDFAFFHVQKLSSSYFHGRAPGTQGGNRAAQYLAGQFQKFGLKPGGERGTYYQTVEGPSFKLVRQDYRWKPQVLEERALESENVLGFLGPGEISPEKSTIIVSAHYDHLGTLNGDFFPGANDNASGLGVLLEVARVLGNRATVPKHQVLFAAWTFEEEGLYGSTFFTSAFPFHKVQAVINLDSLGNGAPRDFLLWTHQAENPLIPLVTRTGDRLGLRFRSRVLSPDTPHTSDHQPFGERGIPAVTILSPNWLERNHTLRDTKDQININKLENATKLVIGVLEELAY